MEELKPCSCPYVNSRGDCFGLMVRVLKED